MRAMAGSPIKRRRKLGIRTEDGSVIAFPYMPRVSELPRRWRHFSKAEKIEHLLGMSLDEIHEILSCPIGELDPFRLSVRMQVIRVVIMIGGKAYLDGTLDREAGASTTATRSSKGSRGGVGGSRSHPRRVRGKPGREPRAMGNWEGGPGKPDALHARESGSGAAAAEREDGPPFQSSWAP
jgi:hypothetical protein